MYSIYGFGRGFASSSECKITVEIICSESHSVSIRCNFPKVLQKYEHIISRNVQSFVKRGKVEINATFEPLNDIYNLEIDMHLADKYRQMSKIIRAQHLCDDDFNVSAVLRSPEVLRLSIKEDNNIENVFIDASDMAISNMLDSNAKYVVHIEERLNNLTNKLQKSVEILAKIPKEKASKNNFPLELDLDIIFANLKSHIEHLKENLEDCEITSRKLSNIIKYITRELDFLSKIRYPKFVHALIECVDIVDILADSIQSIE